MVTRRLRQLLMSAGRGGIRMHFREPRQSRRLRLEALEDRRMLADAPQGVFPDDGCFDQQWGPEKIGAPQAWEVTTGSYRPVVAVIDTGVDYKHEDLYQNIWINEREIPSAIRGRLQDVDGDNLITFADLNDSRNQGSGKIQDRNGNGRIDGGDLLNNASGWEDGQDNDGNGFKDDLIGWDFKENDNNPFPKDKDNTAKDNHGTQVAGILGAMGDNVIAATGGGIAIPGVPAACKSVAGVNWRTRIMVLRFGYGNDDPDTVLHPNAVKSLNYAVQNGAAVVNASWGTKDKADLRAAIEAARDANVVIVAAAGNNGKNIDNNPAYPAGYTYGNILTVAASTETDGLRSDSNFGATRVDLAAPGSNLYTTTVDDGYTRSAGKTSMATPFVTGVVALLQGQHPGWNYKQVVGQVKWGTDAVSALQGKVATGGRLNAAKALTPEMQLLFSTTGSGSLTGSDKEEVAFDDGDIIQLSIYREGNALGYRYGMYFDASDVGLGKNNSSEDIDALTVLPNGDILISTVGSFSIPGPLKNQPIEGEENDILRFRPTSLGRDTRGTWSLYFDGSDVGLNPGNNSEDIDALDVLPDGRIIISTRGSVTLPESVAPGVATRRDEDLLAFTPTTLGNNTSGRWRTYFDGSDVGFNSSDDSRDIGALYIQETSSPKPDLYLATKDRFTLPNGLVGNDEDIVRFDSSKLGADTQGTFDSYLTLNGSRFGLANFDIDGLHIQYIRPSALPLPGSSSGGTLFGETSTVVIAGLSAVSAQRERNESVEFPIDRRLCPWFGSEPPLAGVRRPCP